MARLAAQQGSLSARVLALGLCRYVKVDLRQCCVEAAAGQGEVLDRTHEAMTALLERYDVCFMADRIERHADPTDRRVSIVQLTPAGRHQMEKGTAALVATGFGPVRDLTDTDRRSLATLLAAMRGAVSPAITGV